MLQLHSDSGLQHVCMYFQLNSYPNLFRSEIIPLSDIFSGWHKHAVVCGFNRERFQVQWHEADRHGTTAEQHAGSATGSATKTARCTYSLFSSICYSLFTGICCWYTFITYFFTDVLFILWLIVLILKEVPMGKCRVQLKLISSRDPVLIPTKETEILWFNIEEYETEHCWTE